MMGDSDPQPSMFYNISLEKFVPQEHPLRRIRPLIDDATIRKACKPLYSKMGRPSIPPEQLFLALVGGYVLGIPPRPIGARPLTVSCSALLGSASAPRLIR